MVQKCREKLRNYLKNSKANGRIEFFIGNAAYLPFSDNYFDAVFHFGGINEFSDQRKAFQEINRVVHPGGKVVIGDESMAPWLRDKEYGKILINNNHLLAHKVPLKLLPEDSQNVCLRWILGNSFYLIDYEIGNGLPAVNLDLPHKGRRGGTLRTRYFGQLEGVTVGTKQLAQRAVEITGESMHEWLDNIVRQRAETILKNKQS
jgi:SAM-dependent methyltransferase